MSVNSTSPADLFGGTWEAMPAGRVLLAQGTSEWGVEYQAGSTGGEHEHQLSVGELPSHNHNGSTNNTGDHTHKIYRGNNGSGGAYVSAGQIYPLRQGAITDPDISGSHGHTVIIDNTGGGNAHNSMQPYLSVFMWQRTQ